MNAHRPFQGTETTVFEHSAQERYTGAEAAVAVAECGLATWRAAKQAWLEAVAALPGPESGSARTSWTESSGRGW